LKGAGGRREGRVRVLVTGVGGGGNGEQMVKALRLASTQYHIIGTDVTPFGIGLYHADEGYVVPRARDASYIDAILNLCVQRNVQAVITGSEPEMEVLSEHRGLFQDRGIFLLLNSPKIISLCSDKWRTYAFLRGQGFTVPLSQLITDLDIAGDFSEDDFPLVVKPAASGGGSRHAYIAQSAEEMRFFCGYIMKDGLIPMVQEYIGTPQGEFTVGVLHDLDGHYIDSLAMRRDLSLGMSLKLKIRNRTKKAELSPWLVISSGYSQGWIDCFPEVSSVCVRIADALGSCGPLNVQCRIVGGEVYTFEINPRLSGTSSIRAMVGFNEADMLIRRHVLGDGGQLRDPIVAGYVARGLAERVIALGDEKPAFHWEKGRGEWQASL